MAVSEARSKRLVKQAKLDWAPLGDARRGVVRHEHHGLLTLLVAGLAAGLRTLRGVEALGDDLRGGIRRMGLRRPPSDTSLYRVLKQQPLHGFALVLVRQVKEALLRKWIGNDLFEEGVVAIDGKCVWSGHHRAHPMCQEQKEEGKRSNFTLMAQRASLVSSSARPCVTQRYIAPDAGESNTFPQTFAFLQQHFRRSFEIVTSDAGATSRANAKLVHGAEKAYVFAVKGSQQRLYAAARTRLGAKDAPGDHQLEPAACTTERADGAEIIREFFSCAVDADDPEIEFAGARQLWRERTTLRRTRHSGHIEEAREDRYFVTNRVRAPAKALLLIRLHWGIENGTFWTLDVIFGEDKSAPCETGNGLLVTGWLRLLAFNVASIFRHKLPPRRDEAVASWARVLVAVRDSLLGASIDERPAFLA